MPSKLKVCDHRHPTHSRLCSDWIEWRIVYEGGTYFRDEYLKKYSDRESYGEFYRRKEMTNIPTLASSAVDEVKNSIFQRITDVARIDGPVSYRDAIVSNNDGLGVDLEGNSMNSFIGRVLLPELLITAKVGVWVDKPMVESGATLNDTRQISPYIYHYRAEDILSWSRNKMTHKLESLLLKDHVDDIDERTGLVMGTKVMYRLARLIDEGVWVQWYDQKDVVQSEVLLDLPEIPFTVATITNSLLKNTSSYQKALLNATSSDIAYILGANLPFYTEQFDMQAELAGVLRGALSADGVSDGSVENAVAAAAKAVMGHSQGRRYAKGLDRPGFIHPSSEPLMASMKKQAELKKEIREIINLNVSSLLPSRSSGESKKEDAKSLEAGLSYIGLELEYAENEIARIWGLYEDEKGARITYPGKYSIRSEAEIRDEAKEYTEIASKNPSPTYQRHIAKHVATITIGAKVSTDELRKIHQEIESAEVVITDPEILRADVEAGLVSRETASKARNYPDGEIEIANEEHAERATRIALAQSDVSGRGVNDMGAGDQTTRNLGKEGDNDDTNAQ